MKVTLPADKPVKPVLAPHNYFIYGAPMSGKSYFASFFPHPLSLNTDGNSEQGTAPSIQIRNLRNSDGSLKQSCIDQLDGILTALQDENNSFQTIIIDVIDDICVMIEQAICIENNVRSLSDMGYGKGFSIFNTTLQQFVMDLKSLPLNVIYISRENEINDDNSSNPELVPSLKTKYYNIVNGNCDLVIHTQKFGKDHYTRTVTDRRAKYKPADIKNERVRQLLESCKGMF